MKQTLPLPTKRYVLTIAGVTLHWTASILGLLAWTSVKPPMQTLSLFGATLAPTGAVSIALFALLLTLLARCFRHPSAQKAMGLVSLAANGVAFTGLMALSSNTDNEIAAYVATIGRDIGSACLILLWGLRFASLDKHEAGHVIATCAPLTIITYCLVVGIASHESILPVLEFVYCVSSLCFLATIVPVPRVRQSKSGRPRVKIAAFYASRAGFGLAIGAFSVCTVPVDSHALWPVALAIGLGGVAFFVYSSVRSDESHRMLTLLPLLASGCILAPLLDHGFSSIAEAASAIAWFSWILLSSFQLSSLRETFRLDAAFLSFSEKAVLLTFWAIGTFTGKLALGVFGDSGILDSGSNLHRCRAHVRHRHWSHLFPHAPDVRPRSEHARRRAFSRVDPTRKRTPAEALR